MREFDYYLEKNMVKRAIANPDLAKSLAAKAETRIKMLENEKATEETSSIIFEETYEAIREAAQSLMHIKGFKPYSHEALIALSRTTSQRLVEWWFLSMLRIFQHADKAAYHQS